MIDVILNVYKRPFTLERQIECVLNQSVKIKPENIHVWYNLSSVPQQEPQNKEIKTYKCNWNTKFWGRFTIPLFCRNRFIAVFDDDVFPPQGWFKNCLDTMASGPGILGGSGVFLKKRRNNAYLKAGWNGVKSEKAIKVDFVGQAWFFKQEWARYMWYEVPATWENAEDMAFSFFAKKYGNIDTFVPPHPEDNKDIWCTDFAESIRVGGDHRAAWRQSGHTAERVYAMQEYQKRGWELIDKPQL